MRYLSFFMALFSLLSGEEAPACAKCQRVREYNEAHPENNYYWYDDYLKEHPEQKIEKVDEELPKLACGCNDKDKHRKRRD